MNYQNRVRELRNEIIAEFHKIKERPEGWLPHTVFVEDENVDCSEPGAPVYNQYKLLDYLPDGECQLLNVITGEEEVGSLSEIEIDWLVTVLNWYGELTGNHIIAEESKESYAFLYAVETMERNATDEEIVQSWEDRDGSDLSTQRFTLDEFAEFANDECFCESQWWVRFIKM